MAAARRADQRLPLRLPALRAREVPVTDREATDRLLAACRAAAPLLRHGLHQQAAAVLEDAEAAVRCALRIPAEAARSAPRPEGA